MKKPLLLLTALLVFAPVLAISVSHTSVVDRVYPGENVKYVLNVTNNGSITDYFHVISWSTWTHSIDKTAFHLGAGESRLVSVELTIPIDVQVQKNEIKIDVTNDQQIERQEVTLVANAITLYPQGFSLPSFEFPSRVDPRDGQELKATVKSELDKRLPGALRATIKDSNNELVLVEEESFSYDPLRDNELSMVINFPEKLAPGKYFIEVEAYVTSRLIGRKSGSFDVTPYFSITQSMAEDSSILGQSKIYVITNAGTGVYQDYTVSEEVGLLSRILIMDYMGAIVSGDTLTWTVNVPAGETILVGYTISFIPLILLPFVLVALAYVYWLATRKIILKKEVVRYYSKDNHTVVKVMIKVSNASRKTIRQVDVVEPLSPFASKISDFHTLKPRLQGGKDDRRLEWRVDKIGPKSEVVLSYAVHAKVGIVGQMFFEPTIARFAFKGKQYEERSNVAGFEARTE